MEKAWLQKLIQYHYSKQNLFYMLLRKNLALLGSGECETQDLSKALSTPHFIVGVAKLIWIIPTRKCVSSTFSVTIFPKTDYTITLRSVLARRWLQEEVNVWRPQPLVAAAAAGGRATVTTFLVRKAPMSRQSVTSTLWSVLPCASHSPARSSSGQRQIFSLQLIKMEVS